MKKHSIIAYTLEEGDKLYCVRDGEIKEIMIREEHLLRPCFAESSRDDRYYHITIEPLIDEIYLQPGEKVRQSENGHLILWKRRHVEDLRNSTNRSRRDNLVLIYEEVETDLAVSTDLLNIDSLLENLVTSSSEFKDVQGVTLYSKETGHQIGTISIAEFLALHPDDAKSMLEDRGIEAIAVKNNGTTKNYEFVLKIIASKRQ